MTVHLALATMEFETLPRSTLSSDVFPERPTMMVSQSKREAVSSMTLSGCPDSTMLCASAPTDLAFSRAAWDCDRSFWMSVSAFLAITDRMISFSLYTRELAIAYSRAFSVISLPS